MARIERVSAQGQVPVKQAQLIDPNAFRLSTASAEALGTIGGVITELGQRKRDMQDRLGISNANAAMENAQREMASELENTPFDQRDAVRLKHINNAKGLIAQQNLSAEAGQLAQNKVQIWADSVSDLGQLADIQELKQATDAAVIDDYENALVNGSAEDIAESEAAFQSQFATEPTEVFEAAKVKVEARAEQAMSQNAINNVHAAIEAGSEEGGTFDMAKELAKNPLIPEQQQTSLRTAIKTAEKAKETKIQDAKTEAINTATSTAIREYFKGNQTVANLNQKHEAGLIKDSEFKTMMNGLQSTAPENSNPFAKGRVRRATADFQSGAISREEADKIISEQYSLLDMEDRESVFVDLEDAATSAIGTAKSNSYNEGRSLMSVQFVGIETQDEFEALILATPGLTEEEKKRVNRRFEAEVANRDLYERAVDEQFRQMRKDGVTETKRFSTESLRILLEYQKRKKLNLEALEAKVAAEQKEIIGTAIKPVSKMTQEEKDATLQKLAELKRLAK